MKTKEKVGKPGLLGEVLAKLNSGGLTIEEFEKKRHEWIVPGTPLEVFIAEAVDSLGVKLDGDLLVWNRELAEAKEVYEQVKSQAQNEAKHAWKVLKLELKPQSHQ